MEREKYNMSKNYSDIISKLNVESTSETDFCNKVVSLDVNDDFDSFLANNESTSELFDLCIRYLDNETTDKEEIWSQIKSIIK